MFPLNRESKSAPCCAAYLEASFLVSVMFEGPVHIVQSRVNVNAFDVMCCSPGNCRRFPNTRAHSADASQAGVGFCSPSQ
jgi:hypothetical protein